MGDGIEQVKLAFTDLLKISVNHAYGYSINKSGGNYWTLAKKILK